MQLSDKEMDKMINDAAGQFEPTGATPDWEAMQLLLDQQLPVKKDRRRRPFFWLFSALLGVLVLTGVYYLLNRNLMQTDQPATVKKTGTVKNGSDNNNDNTIEQRKPVTKGNGTKTPNDTKISTTKIPTVFPGGRKNNLKDKTFGTKTNLPGILSSTINKGKRSDAPSEPAIRNSTAGETDNSTNPGQYNSKEPLLQDTISTVIEKKTGSVITKLNKVPEADTTNSIAVKKTKKNTTKKRLFEISLLYAPELTTIKFSNFDKPGSNYGILAGYQVINNLTIQTGVILSRKNYIANGKDYRLSYTVSPPYKLKSVQGYCDMFEIPLNLKYQVTHNKKFNVSVTGGLSSYFMTKESYTYEYVSNYNSYNRHVKYSSQKNYWFSLAMIGVSVEKEISNNFNIAATPFLKIPFKGMGSGDLKLIGTGINFSLIYRPALKK